MEWKDFSEWFNANFRRGLGENDGLPVWAEFIAKVREPDALFAAILPETRRYANLVASGKSAYPPTLQRVRDLYFAELRRRRQEDDIRRFGGVRGCGFCRGVRFVVCLGQPATMDAKMWPPDFRDRSTSNWIGCVYIDCPRCNGDKFDTELRRRIEANSLPERVPPGHADYPDWLPPPHCEIPAATVMLEYARRFDKTMQKYKDEENMKGWTK
ncbi:MAG: hypothetical protein PHI35_07735 [Victivallaceae bacterium]|nr:hypothetical protein [Victivallaceae bacterium]